VVCFGFPPVILLQLDTQPQESQVSNVSKVSTPIRMRHKIGKF
jgi:hypothetical protein